MKKVVAILLTLVLALGICIIPVNDTQVSAATKKRTVTKTKICGVGDYIQLIKGTNGKVKWKSSNSKVVSIDSTTKSYCLAKAKKAGTATISVTYKNVTYKWKITVKKVKNVKNKSITATIEYLSKVNDEALWFHSSHRNAVYTGKTVDNKPHKRGSFTTTNDPTDAELKFTVDAFYNIGEYVDYYYATESTGKYYFFNYYDNGNIIMAARYSKDTKLLVMAYYAVDDNGSYYVVFRFKDGKYEQHYDIYRGDKLTNGSLYGIPFEFGKDDSYISDLHTFDSLSVYGGSIYDDVDLLLRDDHFCWLSK